MADEQGAPAPEVDNQGAGQEEETDYKALYEAEKEHSRFGAVEF